MSGNSEDEIGKSLAKFWENNTGEKLGDPYSLIGIINNDCRRLDGVVLFTEYTGSNIEIHFLGFKCLNRTVIKFIANYVFNELNCNILRVKPHSNNFHSVQIIKRLGFEYEYVLEDYYSLNDHAVLFKMSKNKVRKWINLNERTKAA